MTLHRQKHGLWLRGLPRARFGASPWRVGRRGVPAFVGALVLLWVFSQGRAADRPRLYLELIEPSLEPEEVSLCQPALRFKVLVSHEQDELCGAFFGLSAEDAQGAVLLPLDFQLEIDPVWHRSRVICAEIPADPPGVPICGEWPPPEGHVSVFLDCFHPGTSLRPSNASPIGELSFRLPEGFDGLFQVMFDNPVFWGDEEPDDPASLVFVGAVVVEDIELSHSPVLEYHPVFLRGDPNDDGTVDISDPVKVFEYLFLAPTKIRCLDAADADDDGILNITDGIYVLQFLFLGGPAPLEPYPAPGIDPSEDALACEGCYPAAGS